MNTSNDGATIAVGVIALILGIVIGVAGVKMGRRAFTTYQPSHKGTNEPAMAAMPNSANPAQWDLFQQIRDMQAQMDQSFDQMNASIEAQSGLKPFQKSGYSLSLDVRDLKDHYEVRGYLPDANAADVKVSVQNNQTLKVDVDSKENEKAGGTNAPVAVTEWGQYDETVQLPAPVDAAKMKIEHKGHELFITIPKED